MHMHLNVLTKEQKQLLPLLAKFNKNYILVGGTAVALYLGHRYSIDFDLFNDKQIKRKQIKNIIAQNGFTVDNLIYEAFDQLHLLINNVKITFYQFPHTIRTSNTLDEIINMPDLLTLAAMKAYALGGRAKWKDYVDLFIILKTNYSFNEISNKAKELFDNFFNVKLFKEQLSYFEDLDYSEPIEWILDNPPSDEEIKSFLIQQAIQEF
jgi:arsenate reductase-like glutaredoxin family protein